MIDDLHQASEFYRNVFGVESTTIPYSSLGHCYRTLTVIADTCIENISPEQSHLSPFRMYTDIVGNHWFFPCFYVSDMQDAVYELHHRQRIRLTASGTGAPVVGLPSGNELRTLLYTNPTDTGIMWEFWEGEDEWFRTSPLADPRLKPGWNYRPPAAEDPLAVQYLSHQTVVLNDSTLALKFLVDICGGTVFDRRENKDTGTESDWVAVGEEPSVFELAHPIADGPAMRDLQRCGNTVHTVTFKVRSLSSAVAHLKAKGLKFETETDQIAIVDPRTAVGMRLGFVDRLAAGDPRTAPGVPADRPWARDG